MKINLRAQRFACAIFLLLSFQLAYNSTITMTKPRRSSTSSDDHSSSRSSDNSSSSKRSSRSSTSSKSDSNTSSKNSSSVSEFKTIKNDSPVFVKAETIVNDSPASVKTETVVLESKSEQQSSRASSYVKVKDDADDERRQVYYDDCRKEEERQKKQEDEQWTKDWEERDAIARKRIEEKRLVQVEFERIVQAKTIVADIPVVVQVIVEEKKEAIPVQNFITIDFVTEEKFKAHPKEPESTTQQDFFRSNPGDSKIKNEQNFSDQNLNAKINNVESERSERELFFQKEDEEIKDDFVKIFIPTREFYEKNKEYLSCVKQIRGHPIFIPENIKFSVNTLQASNNSYHAGNSDSYFFSSNMHSDSFSADSWGKNNKNIPTRAQILAATIAALGRVTGAAGSAVAAGVEGSSIVLTGPLIPVMMGTVVVGYVATVIIPGLMRPVAVIIEPNTQNMTKEQYEQYLQAKKQQDDLEKQQNIIRQSKQANDLVFKNGVFVECAQSKTINLDPVDPQLMYIHSPLQRALDISSAVTGSTDRFSVVDGKVIKFTLQKESNLHYVPYRHARYEATIVEDFGKLSSKDVESLRKCWNFDAKKKHKEKTKAQKKLQKDISRTSNSGPGKDPDDDKDKKDKKKTDETFDKEKYQHDKNKFSENPNDIAHMFRQTLNKLEDSIINRKQVLEMVQNKDNCCGLDHNGVVSYVRIQADGSQLWAEVNPLKQIVRNCGNNPSGQHRVWNSITGLKQAPYKI